MKYRALGCTGLVVSEVGFGAWGIGGRTTGHTSYGDTDDGQSLAAIARAVERGITLFDTSSAYGNGHSEELLGQGLRRVRSGVIIATKAGYESWDQPPDFSARAIIDSAERSLARLGMNHLDLLQLHNPTVEALRQPDLQEALSRLVAAGKIRAWGISAKSPQDALEALALLDVPVVQANFNMMDVRSVTSGLFDELVRRKAGFIARTPLCFGFLTGMIRRDTAFLPGDHRLGWPRRQLENWIDGADALLAAVEASPGVEAVQSALRFCLSFPAVSSVIPGILTAAEVDQNAAASANGPLEQGAVEAVMAINRRREFFLAPSRTA